MLSSHESQHSPQLQQLLQHPQLWRARQQASRPQRGQPTGYAALDATLAAGGWPQNGLMELLAAHPGSGELRLLAPLLARLSQEQRWLLWVDPPHLPYAPTLAAWGIDISRVLLVHTQARHDALWTLEQALQSGTCSMALGWLDESRLDAPRLRRLQIAARQGNTLAALFRPTEAARQPSMAGLRLALQADASGNPDQLQLDVLKQPGGWPGRQLSLRLTPALQALPQAELQARLQGWQPKKASAPSPSRRPPLAGGERLPRPAYAGLA